MSANCCTVVCRRGSPLCPVDCPQAGSCPEMRLKSPKRTSGEPGGTCPVMAAVELGPFQISSIKRQAYSCPSPWPAEDPQTSSSWYKRARKIRVVRASDRSRNICHVSSPKCFIPNFMGTLSTLPDSTIRGASVFNALPGPVKSDSTNCLRKGGTCATASTEHTCEILGAPGTRSDY
jgi:hypothetical protein